MVNNSKQVAAAIKHLNWDENRTRRICIWGQDTHQEIWRRRADNTDEHIVLARRARQKYSVTMILTQPAPLYGVRSSRAVLGGCVWKEIDQLTKRCPDGSAGDVDYGTIGGGYSKYRQPEPRIAALIHASLGDGTNVLNVGAGAGSYEPVDRNVTAVEPSASMRAQRPLHRTAIDAVAEWLPFPDNHFDAAMATFTVHQWSDLSKGLREMRRVTRGRIVIMTCDPEEVARFWLNAYAPEVLATEARRYPAVDAIAAELGGRSEVIPVPIPLDCVDGFNEAYYGRPDRLLEPAARATCSAWSFVDRDVTDRFTRRLAADLADGTWDGRYGFLRKQPEYVGSLRLIISLGNR